MNYIKMVLHNLLEMVDETWEYEIGEAFWVGVDQRKISDMAHMPLDHTLPGGCRLAGTEYQSIVSNT